MNTPYVILFACLAGTPMLHAGPRDSTNYSVAAEAVDAGGQSTGSANYSQSGSLGGVTGVSASAAPVETAKHGYIGQLYDVTSVAVSASPASVDEGGTRQLAAAAALDDATSLLLSPADVAWSIVDGPLTGIDAGGLATAGAVFEDSAATARGSFAGIDGELALTVLDTDPDNFGTYAGDKLPDAWQVGYFGIDNPDAAPGIDADSDDFDNFFEFAVGTDPTLGNGASLSYDLTGGTFVPGGPVLEVQFSPLRVYYRFVRRTDHAAIGLGYTPEFSNELSLYEAGGTAPTVLIPDPGTGYELVEVRAPLFLSTGRKVRFSRLRVGFD